MINHYIYCAKYCATLSKAVQSVQIFKYKTDKLNYLLLLPDDSSSAESLLRLLELPEDSLPWDSFPWESLPWDSLPWDSVPLPLDPLLFISTSSWRERVIFRLLWGEAGGSWLLSLPSDARPSSAPSAKLPIRCNDAIELQPAASLCPSREENRYGLESESSDIGLGLKKWSKVQSDQPIFMVGL